MLGHIPMGATGGLGGGAPLRTWDSGRRGTRLVLLVSHSTSSGSLRPTTELHALALQAMRTPQQPPKGPVHPCPLPSRLPLSVPPGLAFSTHALLFMVVEGFGAAASTRVANELGGCRAGRGRSIRQEESYYFWCFVLQSYGHLLAAVGLVSSVKAHGQVAVCGGFRYAWLGAAQQAGWVEGRGMECGAESGCVGMDT